jgi:hypothetical protein
MKTGKGYFYANKTVLIPGNSGRMAHEHFTVYEVNIFNNNIDKADRKAKTVNDKLGYSKMPGGYFSGKCIPYNFQEDYTVIPVPNNTKIQPYTEADKFIMALIEYEENMEYTIF